MRTSTRKCNTLDFASRVPVWIREAEPSGGTGGNAPCGNFPAVVVPDRQQTLPRRGAEGKENLIQTGPCALLANKKDSPADCPFSIPGKVWQCARGHPWEFGRFRSVAPCAACGGRRSLTGKAGSLAPCPPSLPRYGPGQDKRISGKGSFAACGGKRGSRPRPLRWAASLPPLAACGPLSLPTLGGGVAPPAPPAIAVGDMWRLVAACGGSGQASRQPLRGGTPPQCKAKPLRGGPMARPCIAPPPRRSRRRCSGAARPPRCGGCGAVRPSGPVGGAPASLASPATPAAQAVPRGSAYALAARRSGRRPSRLSAAKPGRRASGRSSAAPVRGLAQAAPLAPAGPQFRPPRALAAQAPPPRAFARGGARGNAACGRDGHA